MAVATAGYAVGQHFTGRVGSVKTTYDALVAAARRLGPVREVPKKTTIHLERRTAFAGIATRRAGLIVTLKSASDIKSQRVRRREQISANRWHLEIELVAPADVDAELCRWLESAYELAR